MLKNVINFYVEFSKNRLFTQRGNSEFLSAQATLNQILNTLTITAAPVLIYTAQEIFENMDHSLFENNLKPRTVFQMPWPLPKLLSQTDPKFLAQFE